MARIKYEVRFRAWNRHKGQEFWKAYRDYSLRRHAAKHAEKLIGTWPQRARHQLAVTRRPGHRAHRVLHRRRDHRHPGQGPAGPARPAGFGQERADLRLRRIGRSR